MTDPWQAFVLGGWGANILAICYLIAVGDPGRVEAGRKLRDSTVLALAPWAVLLSLALPDEELS